MTTFPLTVLGEKKIGVQGEFINMYNIWSNLVQCGNNGKRAVQTNDDAATRTDQFTDTQVSGHEQTIPTIPWF